MADGTNPLTGGAADPADAKTATTDANSTPGKGGGSAGDAGFSSPYEDDWGRFQLDTLLFPGVVISVDGCERPYEWAVQKATGKGGATTVFKGEKSAESIKFVCELPHTESFEHLYVFRDAIKPAQGGKPPTLPLINPVCNFNGVCNIALKQFGQPKWEPDRASWTVEIEFTEDRPSTPAATGPADPAKTGTGGAAKDASPGAGAAKDAQDAAST